jgi:predicted Zn-dependent protease
MNHPNKLIVFLLLPLCALGTLLSCESMAGAVSAGARVAGALGYIDQEAADTLSQSADSWARALAEITPEEEYYIGRAVAANILTTYQPYNGNPGLTAYLNRICAALAINSPRPEVYNGYHVMILDSQEINAFATSGGHIFITRGLLACTDSEDSLAAVIAHELSHVQLQHSIKAIKTSRFTQAILTSGSGALSAAGQGTALAEMVDTFGESVGEIVTALVNNGYSQDQEFDADTTALALLASAGYEPSSLLDMLRILERNQPGTPGGFNKTHPSPAQRIGSAERAVGAYQVTDTRSFRQARYTALR